MTKDKLHAVEQLQAHETNNVALAQELASLRTESSSNVKSFEERLKLASEAMMHKVTMEKYEAIHTLDQELRNIQVEKDAISVTLSQLRQDYRRLLEEMLAYKEREENAKEREEKGKELAAELHNAVLRLVDEKKAIAQRHDLQRRENNKITRELLQTVQQQEAQLKALGAERESEVKGKHSLEVQCRKLSEENQRYEHEFGQMAQKSKSNKALADKHEQVAAKLAMERDRLLKEYHSAMQREGVVSKALDDANNTLAPLKSEYHVVKSHKDALQEELNKLKAEVLLFKDRDSIAANRLQQRDVTIANLKQEMAETHEREAARSSAFKEVQAAFEQQEQLLRAVTAERDAEAERSRQLADQVRELKLMTSSATQTLDTGRRQMVEELSAIHKQVHALTLEKQRSLDAFNELAREKAAQSERSMRLYEEQRQLVLQAEERARNLVEEKLVVEQSLAALKQGVLTLQAQSQRQHDEDLAAREVLERKVDELSQHAAMQAEALGKTEAAYESRLRILKEAKGMDEETERRLAQLIVERDRAMAGLQLLEGKSLTLGEELAAAHAREAMAQQLATDKLRAMGKHLEEKDYDIQQLEATLRQMHALTQLSVAEGGLPALNAPGTNAAPEVVALSEVVQKLLNDKRLLQTAHQAELAGLLDEHRAALDRERVISRGLREAAAQAALAVGPAKAAASRPASGAPPALLVKKQRLCHVLRSANNQNRSMTLENKAIGQILAVIEELSSCAEARETVPQSSPSSNVPVPVADSVPTQAMTRSHTSEAELSAATQRVQVLEYELAVAGTLARLVETKYAGQEHLQLTSELKKKVDKLTSVFQSAVDKARPLTLETQAAQQVLAILKDVWGRFQDMVRDLKASAPPIDVLRQADVKHRALAGVVSLGGSVCVLIFLRCGLSSTIFFYLFLFLFLHFSLSLFLLCPSLSLSFLLNISNVTVTQKRSICFFLILIRRIKSFA